jgi:hypothetical protein
MSRKAGKNHTSLFIEIQRMWNLKYVIVPVIIGATGIVTKGLKKSLEAVTEKPSIHSLQKTTTGLLRMPHTIREVLQSAM